MLDMTGYALLSKSLLRDFASLTETAVAAGRGHGYPHAGVVELLIEGILFGNIHGTTGFGVFQIDAAAVVPTRI